MRTVKTMRFLSDQFAKKYKSLAVLIDPDKIESDDDLIDHIKYYSSFPVDLFFVGGSLLTSDRQESVIKAIKSISEIPVILFPGSNMYIDLNADGILFLSLISGRNPEYLIGQHVVAAPMLKRVNIEVLPTGYILVGEDRKTTVAYISNTVPIPSDKDSIAACTAMAGEMLGLKMIYLDAGSGAKMPVPEKMIKTVKSSIDIPLIVGGGINTISKAETALKAGADVLVIGNGIEAQREFLPELITLFKAHNHALNVH